MLRQFRGIKKIMKRISPYLFMKKEIQNIYG
jgi:hypothetical protein